MPIPTPSPAKLAPNERIIQLANDGTNLYALTNTGRIFESWPGWTWTEIPGPAREDENDGS